ncbi:AraC family transcriptional regulator [Desulfovibrio inopinatus]|uniref:AraC family transcriptional regulator n=1 Tax=Desulfovibrio inopinatus TaxID=102109 RepID=UPI0003FF8219|nr:AraC family transcriptional regulator [Desulfovibrio inopinatus]
MIGVKEWANFFTPEGLDGVECLRAHFMRRRFQVHAHDGYAVGVITSGALGFEYRGERLVATTGIVNTVVPGEPHTGEAAGEVGWSYRMLYLDAALVRSMLQEADVKSGDIIFTPGIVHDASLAARIATAHRLLEEGQLSVLARQSLMRSLVVAWMIRHGRETRPGRTLSFDPTQALHRVRQKLEDEYAEDVSLEELADLAGLSPWHLNRAFRQVYGLPPHRYQTMIRVRQAKSLLLSGARVVDAALETGFYDQSHLTRHFTPQIGVSPGLYRKSVQEKR